MRWWERQPDRPFWHVFLLGGVLGVGLTAAGVSFIIMVVACGAAGFILGGYDFGGDES